jgi:hypothetical protein
VAFVFILPLEMTVEGWRSCSSTSKFDLQFLNGSVSWIVQRATTEHDERTLDIREMINSTKSVSRLSEALSVLFRSRGSTGSYLQNINSINWSGWHDRPGNWKYVKYGGVSRIQRRSTFKFFTSWLSFHKAIFLSAATDEFNFRLNFLRTAYPFTNQQFFHPHLGRLQFAICDRFLAKVGGGGEKIVFSRFPSRRTRIFFVRAW